jgi:hypothetical protein
MRFFQGTRSGDKKKVSASELYKQKLQGKSQRPKTPDEIYKEKLEAKTAKMMEDAIMGRKKNTVRLPGTKQDDDKPKELSKNAQMMLKLLAMQKLQKDAKKEQKKLREEMWAAKAKKKAEAFAKAAQEAQVAQQRKAEEAAKSTDGNSWW